MHVRALPFSPQDALWPAISPQCHLAYTTSHSDRVVWRAPLRVPGEPKRRITRDEADAEYSPSEIIYAQKYRRQRNLDCQVGAFDCRVRLFSRLPSSLSRQPAAHCESSLTVSALRRRELFADGRWIYYHYFGAATRLMSGFGRLESHDGAAPLRRAVHECCRNLCARAYR
jgi:hypothetical protein